MIYFIKIPRIDELVELKIVPRGKKSTVVVLKPEQADARINQEAASYWTQYLKKLLLEGWQTEDLKRQSNIVTALYVSSNYSNTIEIMAAEVPYLLSIEQKDEETTKDLQALNEWLKSARNGLKVNRGAVYELKHNNITFENEENRPSISDFLANSSKR